MKAARRHAAALLAVAAAVLVATLAACAGAGDDATPVTVGRQWNYTTGVDHVWTVCTDQGDRLYKADNREGITAVGGGCR